MKKEWAYGLLMILLLAMSQRNPIYGQVADSLIRQATIRLDSGDINGALQIAGQAYTEASRDDDHQAMGDALMLIGHAENRQGRTSQALRNYFTALREYEWVGSAGKQAAVALTIGDVFLDAGLNEKALEYYQKAMDAGYMELAEKERLHLRESVALANTALQRYHEALALYRQLEADYREQGNSKGQAFALGQINTCLYALGRYEEAVRYNLEILRLSKESDDPVREMAALNNLGYTYKHLGRMEETLDAFSRAARLGREIQAPTEEVTVILANMAIMLQNQEKYPEALDRFFEAEALAERAGLADEAARIRYLVATTYYLNKDYYNAGLYAREASEQAERAGNAGLAASAHLLRSQVSSAVYDYEASLQQYQQYLALRDSVMRVGQVRKESLSQQQYLVERTEKELDEMIYTRQVERMELAQLKLEADKKAQELELLKKTTALQEAELANRELEKDRALQELLLAEERLAAERKDREIKDLKVQQQLQESELRRGELEQERQKQEIRVLTQEKEISELNLQKIRSRNLFLAGATLLSLIILVIIIRSWRFARRTNRKLADQRSKIQQQKEAIESQYDIIKTEREKSERLLLNILPEETAAELKEKGYASPKHYDRVTVLFTDFVGFTQVTEKMTPEAVIRELDYCFLEFDKIIDRHNLEKIKTIGDSYMCAGGIPVANNTNPFDVIRAALEIRDFMDSTRKAREARGEEYWQLRIGVNTGPVVAGVVGKNKFAYDIWGDAVNLASRMESSGEAGKVNISGETYEIVKGQFRCTHRGKVKAKNKGEVDMYFVEGPLETSE